MSTEDLQRDLVGLGKAIGEDMDRIFENHTKMMADVQKVLDNQTSFWLLFLVFGIILGSTCGMVVWELL